MQDYGAQPPVPPFASLRAESEQPSLPGQPPAPPPPEAPAPQQPPPAQQPPAPPPQPPAPQAPPPQPPGHHPAGHHPAGLQSAPQQHTAPAQPPSQAPPGQQPATQAPSSAQPPPQPQATAPAPSESGTGQVRLPPGAPVEAPAPDAAPAQLDATRAAVAVLLIGPAGAGKTTVARHWADRRAVPTASLSLDDVREWVRSGFADPRSGWNDNSEAQYRLARRTCGFAARNFLANGISCIVDDAVFPDRPAVGLGGWKRHVGPGLIPVVLLPGLDVVLERNAARSGNRRLTDEEVAAIHGRMAGWYGSGLPIIDNSRQDVASTAQMLDDVVAGSLASPPAW